MLAVRAARVFRAPAPRRALSSLAPAPAAPAAEAPAPAAAPGSTLWTKLVAFCGGVAVGGAYFLYLNYAEGAGGADHSAEAAVARAAARADAAAAADDVRRRLALLEHQVATLRTELDARGP